MKKKQIIKNYKDFINGDFITNRVLFEKQIRDPFYIKEFRLHESDFDRLCFDFYRKILSSINHTLKEILKRKLDNSENIDTIQVMKDIVKNYPVIAFLYEKIRLRTIYKKNIYVISNEMIEYLNTIPLPENVLFSELNYTFEIPALFLFEDAMLFWEDQFYEKTFRYKAILFLCDEKTKEERFFPEFRAIPDAIADYKNDYIDNDKTGSDFYHPYFHAVIVSLLLMQQKNFDKIYSEFNSKYENLEKEVKENPSNLRKKKLLNLEESFNFTNLDLSFNQAFSKKSNKNDGNEEKREMQSHWRSAHWHTYYIGKRDSEKRQKKLNFVAQTWVGSLDNIDKNNTINFKNIKTSTFD